ncbi:MAG TPA: cell division protein FtsX, partial [Rikenellaceae bacterium]|nr:cell division protein FtsX [Rikenellaceae bacterium]
KEIGIRRVNGATVGDILKMFNMKFVRIVLCCFVVAAPLSWAIVRRYLEGFAYRTPIYWWVFAAALAVVLLVTVAVVTCRSMTAAMENPCETLKRE